MESFKRNSLILFLKKMAKYRRMEIKVKKSDTVIFYDKHHKKKSLDIKGDDIFRPDFQDMFSASEQIGFLRMLKQGIINNREDCYIMVLTNLGILVIDTIKVS